MKTQNNTLKAHKNTMKTQNNTIKHLLPGGYYLYRQVCYSNLCVVFTQCICVLCTNPSKTRFISHADLTDWFIVMKIECVYWAVRTVSLNIK